MFNKIRKMIKSEKGFTLVELLAVIVILGIIVAIAIPAIGNVISNAEKDADDAEIGMIIDAARLYEMQFDPEEYEGEGEAGTGELPVTVDQLLESGFLEERQGTDLPDGWVIRDGDGLEFTEDDPDGE